MDMSEESEILAFLKMPFRTEQLQIKYGRPVEKLSVITWEQKHSVHLPDDLKNFYYSYDGITCSLQKQTQEQMSSFSVNCISALWKIGSALLEDTNPDPGKLAILGLLNNDDDIAYCTKPQFGPRLNAFELSKEQIGSHCLVYNHLHRFPTIWFLDRALEWHYIAPDFMSFFRLQLNNLYES